MFVDSKSKYVNWQELTIQERADDPDSKSLPQYIRIILKNDLSGCFRVGDKVSVFGVVKCLVSQTRKDKAFERVLTLYLEANNIISENAADEGEIDLSQADLDAILALSKLPDIHDRVFNSIAPAVFGCDNIKKGCALQLFGGVRKVRGSHSIRGNIHILIMGDPATAKSQITRSIARIAPRVKINVGRGVSGVGLTAAVVKDEITGNWTLEAGALVLADQGLGIIDEFDKMTAQDVVFLHEVMEQETVSISKAGIVATLNARTSILTTANPKWGRYAPEKTPSENINQTPTILSRFDLIFFLIDKAEVKKDTNIAEHIFDLHCNPATLSSTALASSSPKIAPDLLKKYIYYARTEIQPEVTQALKQKVVKFYVDKRATQKEGAPVAVVARTLEGIIRLAEAHAKMALRKIVTEADFDEVIKLYDDCQKEICFDPETQTIDVDMLQLGKSNSKSNRMRQIHGLIKQMQEEQKDAVPMTMIKERAGFAPFNLKEDEVEKIIEAMEKETLVSEKKKDHYIAI